MTVLTWKEAELLTLAVIGVDVPMNGGAQINLGIALAERRLVIPVKPKTKPVKGVTFQGYRTTSAGRKAVADYFQAEMEGVKLWP